MKFIKLILKFVAVVGVFLAAFSLAWHFYYPYSALGQQMRNLKLAQLHKPIVEARLRNIKGIENLSVSVFTGCGGVLAVSGDVDKEQTVNMVTKEIVATKPPVTVRCCFFDVRHTNQISRIVQPSDAGNSRHASQ